MTMSKTDSLSDRFVPIMPELTRTTTQDALHCDVLIIGAGLAGLSTALSLPKQLQINVLAKADLTACSSHYAQGGIAAVIDAEDSVSEHVNDTLIAGDGLCDAHATQRILAQGGQAIEWLLQRRVPFTTNHTNTADATLSNCQFYQPSADFNPLDCADLHLTQEGGHTRRRVAHADDATGRHIMDTLIEQAVSADNITLLSFHEALSLLTDDGNGQSGRHCRGATVFDSQNHCTLTIYSQAVVLASGGLGQMFDRATAPEVCVGDGMMMAWEAGCRLANLEFIQFHPTGLAIESLQVTQSEQNKRNFLISEAVRGEGGYLLDPITKQRFMPDYDARAELAPRDIVARAIANESENNGLGYVHLDISHQPATFVRQHFPDIYAHCLTVGIDITTDPIPVAPTAHYTCGGVMTTSDGQTDVAGLYAAGEVAHTGLHGANRLASNSLLECVVVGREIAKHLPQYLAGNTTWQQPDAYKLADEQVIRESSDIQTLSSFNVPITRETNTSDIKNSDTKPKAVIDGKSLSIDSILMIRAKLKELMTANMGIKREHASLSTALQQIQLWQDSLIDSIYANEILNIDVDIALFHTKRLLTLASLLIQSAQARLESRGGHYRNDYPQRALIAAISIVEPLVIPTNESALSAFFDNTLTANNLTINNRHKNETGLVAV